MRDSAPLMAAHDEGEPSHEVHPEQRQDRVRRAGVVHRHRVIDGLRGADAQSAVGCAHVRFTPASRTVWHTHPKGQTLHVTDARPR